MVDGLVSLVGGLVSLVWAGFVGRLVPVATGEARMAIH